MTRRRMICLAAVLASCLIHEGAQGENAKSESRVGQQIADFQLADFRGKSWSFEEIRGDRQVSVVVFLGTECPLVKLYADRLVALSAVYGDRVSFIGINSNQQDSLAAIAHFARTHKIEFPLLKDPANKIADAFAAGRTPEVFVLDAGRTVRYHGRIDDQYTYGLQRPKVEREYLKQAVDELLAGRAVSIPETESVGCHIGRILEPRTDSHVTYSHQISRILARRCVECHRPGEIAPFSLRTYDEVVGWAEMIAEVVEEQRMPPWHASAEHGQFANEARLSVEEKRLILDWVKAGAPEGDRADLPAPREFVEGWRIGEPDAVFYMSEESFSVPSQGTVPYKYFVVDPGFTEDKWIQAAECRPGNREVVHHIIVGARGRDGERGVHGAESHWLAATAPGARPMVLPPGMAKHVPAGSKLVFQMHYTPNGTPQEDRSCIGLVFADPESVRQVVVTAAASTRGGLRIPPGASHHREQATHTFRQDSDLLALFPHMHLRGKAFRYTAIHQDGSREILLDIPRYDFNWQNSYVLAEPKRMRAGDKLFCEAWYDNSESNLANPDPTVEVRWGDQTWQEMMIGYFDMVLADQDLQAAPSPGSRTEQFLRGAEQAPPMMDDQLQRLARQALDSDRAMNAFGIELAKLVPQLDRICWTTVEEGSLHVRRVAQRPELARQVGGPGRKVPMPGLRLPEYAKRQERTVHSDIREQSAIDLQFMSRSLASSLHVPTGHAGVAGTVNFWSSEPRAFPDSVAELLEQVAGEMSNRP